MDRFAVEVGEADETGRVVATAAGELDLGSADRLWEVLEPLIASAEVVVLDGSGLEFIDSSGLRILLRAGTGAQQRGAAFRLVAPQPAVQRVLELAGTADRLDVRSSVEAALAG
jgi:anti-anti-sigma factor